MTNDQFPMTNGMTNVQCSRPGARHDRRCDLVNGQWSLGIEHSLVIGHWSLVIPRPFRHGVSITRTTTRPVEVTTAFTLIELILVMALLAIVIAVSAPALSNFF